MNPDYLEEFINALLPKYAVPFGPGEPSMPPAPGIGGPGAMTRAPVADPMSPAMNAAMPMDRAQMGNPSPSVVIPAVLDALRRQQLHQSGYNKFADQNQLNEQQRFRYAPQYGAQDPFPVGQEFSSRPPMQDFTHAVPSGSLSSISGRIAGMGAPMGSEGPYGDPLRTLIMHINNSQSNADGSPNTPGGFAGFEGGKMTQVGPSFHTQHGYSREGARPGRKEYLEGQKANAQAKTDLLAQRGIARGDAANLRSTGLDPRTAALLTAIKGMAGDTGDMANAFVTGGALGGPAMGGAFVKEQGDRRWNQLQADVKREEIAAEHPQPAQKQEEIEKKGGAIAAARAAGGNPQAVTQATMDTASTILAKNRKKYNNVKEAADRTAGELVKNHGVSENDAIKAVSAISGQSREKIDVKQWDAAPWYNPNIMGHSLGEGIWDFISNLGQEPTGSWGG